MINMRDDTEISDVIHGCKYTLVDSIFVCKYNIEAKSLVRVGD